MVRKLDLETWNRRSHFEIFKSYGDPFFNITAEIEVSALRRHVRERDRSFFAASYFLVLRIVNEIEEFRYRQLLYLLACGDLSLVSIWHPSYLTLLLNDLPEQWP